MLENSEEFDFSIETLGECSIDSPLKHRQFIQSNERVVFTSKMEEIQGFIDSGKDIPSFEKAGPRKKIFHDPSWAKAAIVTCGGLCPGLNDVIKGVVRSLYYDYEVRNIFGIRYGYKGLIPKYKLEPKQLNPDVVDGIHKNGGTILGSSRGHQDVREMVDTLVRMNINMLFCIGGDGTLSGAGEIANEIRRRGQKISVIGIPKTIDNDLSFVDRTFGFETAVYTASDIVNAARNEARGVENGLGLVKLMGRDSGFIAAFSSLANSVVDICLIPEVEFTLEGEHGLIKALERRFEEYNHAVLVVAEGAGQNMIEGEAAKDASGNVLKKDVGTFLKAKLEDAFKKNGKLIDIKYFDPSYLIRSLPAHGTDAILCQMLAENAVHAAMAGKTNIVIGHWNSHSTHVPISLATIERHKVNVDGALWNAVLASTRQNDYFDLQ